MRSLGFIALLLSLVVTGAAHAAEPVSSRLSTGEHYVLLDGLRFYYVVAGHGPPAVVQSPGWGIGSEYLRNGWAPLETRFTMIFYDTRGSGRTTRPAQAASISVAVMQEDLERLRAYWGLQTMRLLGHSWGGGIALSYAEHHPEHVASLVLVDTSVAGFQYAVLKNEVHRQWLEAAKDVRLAAAMKSMEVNARVRTDRDFRKMLHTELPFYFYDPTMGPRRFWKTYSGVPSAWVWNAWQTNFDADQARARAGPQPDTIRVPTLIIEGAADRICPPGMAARLHQEIRGSHLEIFERSGHLPWLEQPDVFFDTVERFLGRW